MPSVLPNSVVSDLIVSGDDGRETISAKRPEMALVGELETSSHPLPADCSCTGFLAPAVDQVTRVLRTMSDEKAQASLACLLCLRCGHELRVHSNLTETQDRMWADLKKQRGQWHSWNSKPDAWMPVQNLIAAGDTSFNHPDFLPKLSIAEESSPFEVMARWGFRVISIQNPPTTADSTAGTALAQVLQSHIVDLLIPPSREEEGSILATGVSISPCCTNIALSDATGNLRVYSLDHMREKGQNNAEPLFSWKTAYGALLCVCWSESDLIGVGGQDDKVHLFQGSEVHNGPFAHVCECSGHKSYVTDIRFSHPVDDGSGPVKSSTGHRERRRWMISCSLDGQILGWEVDNNSIDLTCVTFQIDLGRQLCSVVKVAATEDGDSTVCNQPNHSLFLALSRCGQLSLISLPGFG